MLPGVVADVMDLLSQINDNNSEEVQAKCTEVFALISVR